MSRDISTMKSSMFHYSNSNIFTHGKDTLRSAKYGYLYKTWKRRYHGYLKGKLGPYFCDVEDGATPSKELVLLTHALNEENLERQFRPQSAGRPTIRVLCQQAKLSCWVRSAIRSVRVAVPRHGRQSRCAPSRPRSML